MTEVAPGIHRIESILGPRPFSQYLLRGERTLLVDTGVKETPGDVILPFLNDAGVDPAELDLVLLSHADVDHFGGDEAMREAAPRAAFCAHVADVPWLSDRERILRERYGWYTKHGIGYPPETAAWLRDAMGADVPIDLGLAGGETIRLGAELTVQVLHLPGHSPGHLGFYWKERSALFAGDALATWPDLSLGWDGLNLNIPQHRRTLHKIDDLRADFIGVGHGEPATGDQIDILRRMIRNAPN